jgi:hypothetical protein
MAAATRRMTAGNACLYMGDSFGQAEGRTCPYYSICWMQMSIDVVDGLCHVRGMGCISIGRLTGSPVDDW